MEHKHKDLIIKWANNKDIKIEWYDPQNEIWKVGQPTWEELLEYREVDPLKEFKDAHAAGKQVEVLNLFDGSWDIGTTFEWRRKPEDYRIKPELEYIPFDWEDRGLLRGQWVRYKDETLKVECMIDGVDGGNVSIIGLTYSYKELLKTYCFLDGTPCGKLKP